MATKKSETVEESPAEPVVEQAAEPVVVEPAPRKKTPGLVVAAIVVGGVIAVGAVFGGGVLVGANLPNAGLPGMGQQQGPGPGWDFPTDGEGRPAMPGQENQDTRDSTDEGS